MSHDRILSEPLIKGVTTDPVRETKEAAMDDIIVETIIISAALTGAVIKALQLIVLELTEDIGEIL